MKKLLVIALIAGCATQDVCGMHKMKSVAKMMQKSKRAFNVDKWNNKVDKLIDRIPSSTPDVIGVGVAAGGVVWLGHLFSDEKDSFWRVAGAGTALVVGLLVETPLGMRKKYPRGLATIAYPVLYGATLAWFKKSKSV